MALPSFTMRQLLEAGVHFGHKTRRWNPKMGPYIFGVRNGVHIIDLQQTVPLLHRAMTTVRDIVAGGGRVLFVGTKRQASSRVAEAAKTCGQYYVNHRWLGGMLTNWQTISKSIKRLLDLEIQLADEKDTGLTKKELLRLTRERDKLDRALGGIKEMGGKPDVMVVIDTNKEAIAVAEANKLGIPVVGIIDSNSNPQGINFPIPGNDDAIRAITLYCEMMTGSVLDGIQREAKAAGTDTGAALSPAPEALAEKTPQKDAPKDAPKADTSKAVDAPKVAPKEDAPKEDAPKEDAPKAAETAAEAKPEKASPEKVPGEAPAAPPASAADA